MKCHEVQALLSAYYDAEISTDQQIAIEVHLETCSECAARLAEIRRLSQTASMLPEPKPCKKAEDSFDSRTDLRPSGRTSKRLPRALITATAVVLLAAALGIYFDLHNHSGHDDLADYWQAFATNPRRAQEELLTQYSGKVVSHNEAVRLVGYRPLPSEQLPTGITAERTYVLDMPGCKCIQTVCRRADGTILAVFEHNEEQPRWFHGRPQVRMRTGGTSCRVTELTALLAASWRVGPRMVTIVGLRNGEELSQWVHALDPTVTKREGEPTRVGSRGIVPNRRVHVRSTVRPDSP